MTLNFLRGLFTIAALCSCLSHLEAQSTPPWWTATGTAIIQPGATPSNYSPLNIGQLKNVASQAYKTYAASMPKIPHSSTYIGSNSKLELDYIVGSFSPVGGNYSLANLGQLKAVAKPFYDELISLGYDTHANLVSHGFPSSIGNYPWTGINPQNFSPANIGQTKAVFSFDAAADSDADGLPDIWEKYYFAGSLSQTASGQGDSDGVSNIQEYYDDTDPYDPNSKRQVIHIRWGGGTVAPLDGSSYDHAVDGSGSGFSDTLGQYFASGTKNVTFMLYSTSSGQAYLSHGSTVLDGWRIEGSGMEQTVIKLDSLNQNGSAPFCANNVFLSSNFPNFTNRNIKIRNLSIDLNATKWSTTTTAARSQSLPGEDITFPVANAAEFAPYEGYYAIVQSDATRVKTPTGTADIKEDGSTAAVSPQIYGTYMIVDVNVATKSIQLRNLYPYGAWLDGDGNPIPPGNYQTGTIPLGSRIFLGMQGVVGILIGNTNCLVENVHVKNTCCNVYESGYGIAIYDATSGTGYDVGDNGSGNIIRNCLIDRVWGMYGVALHISSVNFDSTDTHTQTTVAALVEGNTLVGNGISQQGIGNNGMDYSVFKNNYVDNFLLGFYMDYGYASYFAVIDNSFSNIHDRGISIGLGATFTWDDIIVCGNTINTVSPSNRGIWLGTDRVSHATVTNNVITVPTGGTGILFSGGVGNSAHNNSVNGAPAPDL